MVTMTLQQKYLVKKYLGGLNQKRHFDGLRDRLGMDVASYNIQ